MPTKPDRPGFALITTLVIMSVLGLIAVTTAQIAKVDFESATNTEEGDVALSAARAGIEDGLLRYRYYSDLETPEGKWTALSNILMDNSCPRSPTEKNQDQKNADIPTPDTPWYIRVNLSKSSQPGQIGISDPFNRNCDKQAYLASVKADVTPSDIYYDLKVSYRDNSIGRIPDPKDADTNPGGTKIANPNVLVNDTRLANYMNSMPPPLNQANMLNLMKTKMNALKIAKDSSVDIAFPDYIDATGVHRAIGYNQFHFVWEADETTVPKDNDGNVQNYGLEAIHYSGTRQEPTLSFNSATFSPLNGLGSYDRHLGNSDSIPLLSYGGNFNNTPERVRLRAWGTDIYVLGWGTGPLCATASDCRIDAGRTTIEAIGQTGRTKRKLTAVIDRADKHIIEAGDFTIFSGSGAICLTDKCTTNQE